MRTVRNAVIGIVAFAVAWFVFWSVDFDYERTTVLPPHLRLVERRHAKRSAWSRGIGLFERRKTAASPDEALVSMQSATERENLVVCETDSRVSVDVPLPVGDAVREFRTAVNDHAAPVDADANAALPFSVSSVHSA